MRHLYNFPLCLAMEMLHWSNFNYQAKIILKLQRSAAEPSKMLISNAVNNMRDKTYNASLRRQDIMADLTQMFYRFSMYSFYVT